MPSRGSRSGAPAPRWTSAATDVAQRRVYALAVEPMAELDAWLEPYRRLWDDRLDALERHLDAKEDR